jgi:hypothetical protein
MKMIPDPPLPLPTLESPQFRELEPPTSAYVKALQAAYSNILRAEDRALQDGVSENIISARVAGHLLLELYARLGILDDQPYLSVIDDIVCSPQDRDNDLIFELGERYRDHLIRPCASDPFSVFVV